MLEDLLWLTGHSPVSLEWAKRYMGCWVDTASPVREPTGNAITATAGFGAPSTKISNNEARGELITATSLLTVVLACDAVP